MTPIWAKDRNGNYKVFPQELVFEDEGRVYLCISTLFTSAPPNDNDWEDWKHLFEYDKKLYAFVLKKQFTNDK